jgi:hypothetical protein
MSLLAGDRIEMSQRERDRLRVLRDVEEGKCSQAKAAQLLKLSVRQLRRLQERWRKQGDGALVHRLRGKPSNRRCDAVLKKKVLHAFRKRYADFGPTFACEKLAQEGLAVAVNTLRGWLLDEGLWQRRRRREMHRRRRPRRRCFGELVQMDTSLHDWTEGRGEAMVLLSMIDDATSRVLARFYPADTAEAHFDLLGRWLEKYGRPRALYTDRHGIFEAHKKGQADYEGQTQFSRALGSQHNLAAILSIQEARIVANDYTVRFQNRLYQLDKPIHPGERGGKVVIELRLDDTMAVRFGRRYLNYHEITTRPTEQQEKEKASAKETPGMTPTNGRSGRTPAEPYPPEDEEQANGKGPYRPAANHPWRRKFLGKKRG